MNREREALDHWNRAMQTYKTAKEIRNDNDSRANRCYYAAFHAVSALFVMEGRTFQSHAGIQSAVHRDLIQKQRWPSELGAGYSYLLKSRMKADYGGGLHVLDDEAERAFEIAGRIIKIVGEAYPGIFNSKEIPLD